MLMRVFNNILIILITLFWITCSSEQVGKTEEEIQNDDRNTVTKDTTPENLKEMIQKGDIDVSSIDISSLTEEQRNQVEQIIKAQKAEEKKFGDEIAKLVGPNPSKVNKANKPFVAPSGAAEAASKLVEKYLPDLFQSLEDFYKSPFAVNLMGGETITEDQKNELMLNLLKIIQYAPNSSKMRYAFRTIGTTSKNLCGKPKVFKKNARASTDNSSYMLKEFTGRFFSDYIFDTGYYHGDGDDRTHKPKIIIKNSDSRDMSAISKYIFDIFYEIDEKGVYKVKTSNNGGILNDKSICR